MLDQLFELSRKATESSLQMQQLMLKPFAQDPLSGSPVAGISADFGGLRKRWLEFTLETLKKHRESIDATYRASIEAIEQASHLTEAKSTEDGVRTMEGVWRKMFDVFKAQAETQVREFQTLAEKSFEMAAAKAHA